MLEGVGHWLVFYLEAPKTAVFFSGMQFGNVA